MLYCMYVLDIIKNSVIFFFMASDATIASFQQPC